MAELTANHYDNEKHLDFGASKNSKLSESRNGGVWKQEGHYLLLCVTIT